MQVEIDKRPGNRKILVVNGERYRLWLLRRCAQNRDENRNNKRSDPHNLPPELTFDRTGRMNLQPR
jgi:hypothetical protein